MRIGTTVEDVTPFAAGPERTGLADFQHPTRARRWR